MVILAFLVVAGWLLSLLLLVVVLKNKSAGSVGGCVVAVLGGAVGVRGKRNLAGFQNEPLLPALTVGSAGLLLLLLLL